MERVRERAGGSRSRPTIEGVARTWIFTGSPTEVGDRIVLYSTPVMAFAGSTVVEGVAGVAS